MAYRILRARRLLDITMKLNHSKQPANKAQGLQHTATYLAERVDRGDKLPEVKLVGGVRKSTRGQGGDEVALHRNVVRFVAGTMSSELVEELKELVTWDIGLEDWRKAPIFAWLDDGKAEGACVGM